MGVLRPGPARPGPPQGAEPWLCRVCRKGQEVACLKSWGPPRPSMQSQSHNSNPFLKGTLTLSKLSNTIGEERFPQEERKVGTDQADGSAVSLLPSLPLCRHCTGATLAKAPGVSHGLGGLGTEPVTRGTPQQCPSAGHDQVPAALPKVHVGSSLICAPEVQAPSADSKMHSSGSRAPAPNYFLKVCVSPASAVCPKISFLP